MFSRLADRRKNSGRPAKSEIVVDYRARSDRNPSRIGEIKFAEDDFVMPDLAKEVLEYLDGQLFTGTAAVAETKGRKAGIIADRHRFTIGHTEDRAEAAIGQADFSTVLDLKGRPIEWTPGEAHLLSSLFVDLGACRHT